MGRKPWLVSTLVLGLGVAFTGCNTTKDSTKDTKYKATPTFTTRDNTTAKQADSSQTQPKDRTLPGGQTTGGSASFVSDPRPLPTNPTSNPTAPMSIPMGADNHLPASPGPLSIQPTTSNSMPLVQPPPLTTNVNKPPTADEHFVPGMSSLHQDDPDSRPMPLPADGAPNSLPGKPLPAINTRSNSALGLPPAPAEPLPTTPAFKESTVMPSPPLPPLGPAGN